MGQVLREISSRPAPFYSLVVYASHQISNYMGGMKIRDIKNIDPFLPQLIYGTEINMDNLEKSMRRGVRYYAGDIQKLRHTLSEIFYEPEEPLRNLAVVKTGGSAIEFREQHPKSQNLRYVTDELLRVKKMPSPYKGKPRQQIIITVGAGQIGNEVKGHMSTFPEAQKHLPRLIAEALDMNLRLVHSLMDESSSLFLQSEDFYFVHKDNARKTILMPIAPHYILARDQIPLQDSDTSTLAMAELYGTPETYVIIIKRTDGVYDFDPNLGGFTTDYKRWLTHQERNKRHSVVTVDDLLSGKISRRGTDKKGDPDDNYEHLIENSALEYYANCRNIKEILVVHIAPEELYLHIRENRYIHVPTGELVTIDPEKGFKGLLEERVRDAFRGVALSRIVKTPENASI